MADTAKEGLSLRLGGLCKRYGATKALDGVSLDLAAGETLALLGPSGCGKSTLLRLIAGLEAADAGSIWLGDQNITMRPPQARGFGLVFQDYALFPHLNVASNIAYGLVERGWSAKARRARVDELLSVVGLSGYGTRKSYELSGGEQQRVALARALAPKPALLLLDEPLSNLDAALREDLKLQLKALLDGLGIGAIYVTHDQSEAFTVADRIAVMRAGKLKQVAGSGELFDHPATLWVARFLGHRNIYRRGEVEGLAKLEAPLVLLRSDLITLGRGAHRALVLSHGQLGALHELELKLDSPAIKLLWSGFAREMPAGIRAGDHVQLEILPGAMAGLEDDREDDRA
jgi:ABC-type Fe3+/spermidine/putrescine transport system ATPase subunit